MASLSIISTSTSGHTEHVIDTLVTSLKESSSTLRIATCLAEQAKPEDLLVDGVLLLACGSWNTGGSEGQLSPHMHSLLRERAKDVSLEGQKVAIIGLGDSRYRYTARALDLLREFVTTHGGEVIAELKIVNEPYGQEEKVREWGKQLLSTLSAHV